MKKFSAALTAFFLLFTHQLSAQSKYRQLSPTTETLFFIGLKAQQGWRTMGEISFGKTEQTTDHFLFRGAQWQHYFEAGMQFNFNKDHFIIGPKVSAVFEGLMLHYEAELVYLTDLRVGTIYLSPKLGFHLNTDAAFYMGFNIPLMRNHMKGLTNRFTVTASLPLYF